MNKIRNRTLGVIALSILLAAPSMSLAFSSGGTRKVNSTVVTQPQPKDDSYVEVVKLPTERKAAPVPEPTALILFGAGAAVAGLALRQRRR